MSKLICGDGNIFFEITDISSNSSRCLDIVNLSYNVKNDTVYDLYDYKVFECDINSLFSFENFFKIKQLGMSERLGFLNKLVLKCKEDMQDVDFLAFCIPWEFFTQRGISYNCCNCDSLEDFKETCSVKFYIKIKGV